MNNISNESPVVLKLTLADAFTIMAGLSELPSKYSRSLMDQIDSQVDEQFQQTNVLKPRSSNSPIFP